MNKNILLLLGVTVLTLLVALGLIRQLAPGLLGGPTDLQLVQLDERVPPFFEGVFREEHASSQEFLLKDPLTRVRARPFYPPEPAIGPNDLLGFRNAAVPVAADIVTIGDSMTYGNNAPMQENWPAWMQSALQREDVNVYNMSTGGWAAVQYLDMLGHAASFRPYLVVVAFYTGNDPLESLQLVNGNENWRWLKARAGIADGVSLQGLPTFSLDAPVEEQWPVTFSDGVATVFTPQYRLISNTDHPGVDAGYALMATAGRMIAEQAKQLGIQPVFTIIPTKELAYADKVSAEGLEAPEPYRALVDAESGRVAALAAQLQAIDGARYVDVVSTLQRAALGNSALYPNDINGHPLAAGYKVIGDSIAAAITGLVPEPASGLYAFAKDSEIFLALVNDEGLWYFQSEAVIEQNGWPEGEVPMVSPRQLLRLPFKGVIDRVDPQRFGPACCQG
ncbi:MAG: SGNH/GDSL hydrolase family protein [Gammaproteobacteria bacterium]